MICWWSLHGGKALNTRILAGYLKGRNYTTSNTKKYAGRPTKKYQKLIRQIQKVEGFNINSLKEVF